MIIPHTIQVEIVDRQGNPNPIEHVLLGVKIFTNSGSWHNYKYVEKAVNHAIHAEPEKNEGIWEDSLPKLYRFTIERLAKER